MPTPYWTWIGYNVGISSAILFFILMAASLLHVYAPQAFFGIVAKLLGIKRCAIDVHHQIIQDNLDINIKTGHVKKAIKHVTNTIGCFETCISITKQNVGTVAPQSSVISELNKTGEDEPKDKQIPTESRSHPQHERIVMNVYGRYLPLNGKWNKISITILTTIIIAAAFIALFNTLIMATTTVYRGSPCPNYGPMDCYCGDNQTYFACNTGQAANFPFDTQAATCFRWIAVQITTPDVTTQIGVTTGLLVAFGNIAQGLIRLYLIVLKKRLNIANGIHRMMAKTVGINRYTAPTLCCCITCCCHCAALSCSLYKTPWIASFVTFIYISVPGLVVPILFFLYWYQFNVTALTFVFLITFAILSLMTIVWIIIQEDETSVNVPGGWEDVKNLVENLVTDVQTVTGSKGAEEKGDSEDYPRKIIQAIPRQTAVISTALTKSRDIFDHHRPNIIRVERRQT